MEQMQHMSYKTALIIALVEGLVTKLHIRVIVTQGTWGKVASRLRVQIVVVLIVVMEHVINLRW